MRLALLPLFLIAGCSSSVTELVVFVEAPQLQVPRDLDALTILVSDRDLPDGSSAELAQSVSPLCPSAAPAANCYSFPLTLTLVPGPNRPGDQVRVELQALLDAKVVIDDAAKFNFLNGARRRLDFILTPACLGASCADSDGACDPSGACVPLDTAPLDDPPDLQN